MSVKRYRIDLLPACLLALVFLQDALAGPVPAPPEVAASAHILMDFNSGAVLSEHAADQRVEPASLTKMMTTYVVFTELASGRLSLQDKVRVSEKAWKMGGSKMFIEVNKEVSVDDLIKGMVIQSGNDASVALAEHVAGSEDAFADLMNAQAKRLGMTGSHFVNATGWPDPDHYVTAHDAAILARALIRDFPEHYAIHAIKQFTYNGIKQYNRNRLLWRDASVDGVKTGHTESAGYCLVASAEREKMRLIAVVMGTKSDEARGKEAQKLLNYGFRFYETHRLFKAGEEVYQVKVWKGALPSLGVGLADDLWVTVPRGSYRNLNASMVMPDKVIAPVADHQALAEVSVTLDDKEIERLPLYALHPVAAGSLWQRMLDHVRLMLED